LREIKIPKQDPTERGMRAGDEEQISDRRERTERERTGEW